MAVKSGKKRAIIVLAIVFVFLIIGGAISGYYVFFAKEKTGSSGSGGSGHSGGGGGSGSGGGGLANPAEGLSIEEAIQKFDEGFVAYILISIKAYNLHPPLFGSDTPKIDFFVGSSAYSAEIVDGRINTRKGEIEGEDIIIWTSAEEAVKMVKDKNYISESFINGASKIELVASKLELAAKGYMEIYNELSA